MKLTKEQVERLVHADPFKDGIEQAVGDPVEGAVRSGLVIALIAHLHERLEDYTIPGRRGVSDLRPAHLDAHHVPPRSVAPVSAARPAVPARLADSERINPYQLLRDLHHHCMGHAGGSDRDAALAQSALAAAVASWWTRWQPGLVHAALGTDADVADIAAATGLDAGEVIRRWRA